jgi:hypothetical protein
MSAHVRPGLLLAFASSALALMASGCGRVPGQFEILNNQIPQSGGGCLIPIEPTVYQGSGKLDVGIVRSDFDTAYLVFPLIENNLPSSGGAHDPNQIQLTGFDVDVSVLSALPAAAAVFDAASALLHFQVPWSGGVSSGGGQISAAVEAFPVALAEQLASSGGLGKEPTLTVNLRVQALGTTNSGMTMQSDPFNFPVEVCNGCLVANVSPCPFASAPANPGNACNPAQDAPVDCCTEQGALICPPLVAQ